MTREQITNLYDVDESGRIRSPGKFEGEMLYVVFFWNAGLEGCADSDDGAVYGFDIRPEDIREFPELTGKDRVEIMEREDGFVIEV